MRVCPVVTVAAMSWGSVTCQERLHTSAAITPTPGTKWLYCRALPARAHRSGTSELTTSMGIESAMATAMGVRVLVRPTPVITHTAAILPVALQEGVA